jgi:hypothetical protein
MRKEISTRITGGGVHSVMPRIAIAPRKRMQRRVDEREDDADEQAPPPPGMGKFVDKSV